MGKYVAFEGPDGSGKSTLVRNVGDLLGQDAPTICTLEPGGNPLGIGIRKLLKDGDLQPLTPTAARRILFEADRIAQQQQVEKWLLEYQWVLSDRHCPVSNACYGAAEGSDRELIQRVEAIDPNRRLADLVVLVDVDMDVAWDRRKPSTDVKNIDPAEKDRGMFERVHAAYRAMIEEALQTDEGFGGHITTVSGYVIPAIVVDGSQRPIITAIRTAAAVAEFFGRRRAV